MEAFTYKGISDGKYVDGEIEALNLDEASHNNSKLFIIDDAGHSLLEPGISSKILEIFYETEKLLN